MFPSFDFYAIMHPQFLASCAIPETRNISPSPTFVAVKLFSWDYEAVCLILQGQCNGSELDQDQTLKVILIFHSFFGFQRLIVS